MTQGRKPQNVEQLASTLLQLLGGEKSDCISLLKLQMIYMQWTGDELQHDLSRFGTSLEELFANNRMSSRQGNYVHNKAGTGMPQIERIRAVQKPQQQMTNRNAPTHAMPPLMGMPIVPPPFIPSPFFLPSGYVPPSPFTAPAPTPQHDQRPRYIRMPKLYKMINEQVEISKNGRISLEALFDVVQDLLKEEDLVLNQIQANDWSGVIERGVDDGQIEAEFHNGVLFRQGGYSQPIPQASSVHNMRSSQREVPSNNGYANHDQIPHQVRNSLQDVPNENYPRQSASNLLDSDDEELMKIPVQNININEEFRHAEGHNTQQGSRNFSNGGYYADETKRGWSKENRTPTFTSDANRAPTFTQDTNRAPAFTSDANMTSVFTSDANRTSVFTSNANRVPSCTQETSMCNSRFSGSIVNETLPIHSRAAPSRSASTRPSTSFSRFTAPVTSFSDESVNVESVEESIKNGYLVRKTITHFPENEIERNVLVEAVRKCNELWGKPVHQLPLLMCMVKSLWVHKTQMRYTDIRHDMFDALLEKELGLAKDFTLDWYSMGIVVDDISLLRIFVAIDKKKKLITANPQIQHVSVYMLKSWPGEVYMMFSKKDNQWKSFDDIIRNVNMAAEDQHWPARSIASRYQFIQAELQNHTEVFVVDPENRVVKLREPCAHFVVI